MTIAWSFPTRIVFGERAAAQTGTEVKALGGSNALVVTDPGVVRAGLVSAITQSLSAAGIASTIFDRISSNPLEAEVLEGHAAFGTVKADIIVSVGGGSPLDVGKLIRLLASHPPPLAQYDDSIGGDAKIVHAVPPMVAIPTTAGTGSEVGRSGVVTLAATNRKAVIFAPRLIPNVAILDPIMTETMPARITAATGFDALTHCIEAYCAIGDHPMADGIALRGIELVRAHLERAVTHGKDLEARGAMLKASMMGAVAFQKGLGVCHSLAHPLSAEAHLHHGLANALCLPAVIDFNRAVVPDRIARIARILGEEARDANALAERCSGAIRALRSRVGLGSGLRDAGVDNTNLPKLATLAMADACHSSNPRKCSVEDMLALYRASF